MDYDDLSCLQIALDLRSEVKDQNTMMDDSVSGII